MNFKQAPPAVKEKFDRNRTPLTLKAFTALILGTSEDLIMSIDVEPYDHHYEQLLVREASICVLMKDGTIARHFHFYGWTDGRSKIDLTDYSVRHSKNYEDLKQFVRSFVTRPKVTLLVHSKTLEKKVLRNFGVNVKSIKILDTQELYQDMSRNNKLGIELKVLAALACKA